LRVLVDLGKNFLHLDSTLEEAVPVCQLLLDVQALLDFRLEVVFQDLVLVLSLAGVDLMKPFRPKFTDKFFGKVPV
jgi:hypothetical protein